jgi:hypothetical protein
MNEIPFDACIELPDKKLEKIGKAQFVHRPSNYHGPFSRNNADQVKAIWISKEECVEFFNPD